MATAIPAAGGQTSGARSATSGASEMDSFTSTLAGSRGAGCWFSRVSLAHGQDFEPSQQQLAAWAWVAHGSAGWDAKHTGIWDNWRTSPMNSAMINLMFIAGIRVIRRRDIPRFILWTCRDVMSTRSIFSAPGLSASPAASMIPPGSPRFSRDWLSPASSEP
jgi:hypothetical protein